jgi:N-acetylmuramoyl-L-alanine amidase
LKKAARADKIGDMKNLFLLSFIWLCILFTVACKPKAKEADYEISATPLATPSPIPALVSLPPPTFEPTASPAVPTPQADALIGYIFGIDPGHQTESDRSQEAIAPWSTETKNRMSSGTAGATSSKREYEINLKIARHLERMLSASGAEVILTRTSNNVNISSIQRARLLSEIPVHFAFSLHCEGANDPAVNGAFAIVSVEDEETGKTAAFMLSIYSDWSGIGLFEDPVISQSDNTLINWSSVPTVWLNMGCLSNAEDEQKLIDELYQERIAYAIYRAILENFG